MILNIIFKGIIKFFFFFFFGGGGGGIPSAIFYN